MTGTAKAGAKAKVISAATIWTRLVHVLDPAGTKGIKPTDPVGNHIKGGPEAVRAFANPLNNSPEFSADGLNLIPGDMANVAVIGDIEVAIIKDYKSRGWTVTA